MKKIYNFSSGPSILPKEVFINAAGGILDFNNTGLSILEISHRSPEFISVLDEAESLVRELLNVPEEYAVLFLSGGASSQFFQVPMNLLSDSGTAAYIDTGIWSAKAIKEASNFGNVSVIASTKDSGYDRIPENYDIPLDADYLHITSNNTIYGTQFRDFPNTRIPLICDMSSDIFSRPINVSDFGMIYAGAQKNMGPAGATLVIIRKDLAGKGLRKMPTILDYKVQIENGSMFNTPPVFAIYTSMLTLRWLKSFGGIKEIFTQNKEKARLLYEEIDRNSLFECPVLNEYRSIMNVVFDLKNLDLTEAFLKLCMERNINGIKGHRTRGGFRASIYNAMEMEGVEVFIQVLKEFENSNG